MAEKSMLNETKNEATNTPKAAAGPFGEVFFEWVVPEFTEHKRSAKWYFWMIAASIALIIYSIVATNFLLALIVILIIFIIFLRSYYQPKQLTFQMTESGILIGDQFFAYEKIKNFYLIYDPPFVKKVYFMLKGFRPVISINLNDTNPLLVREKLLLYLDEDLTKEKQSLDDLLDNLFKL